MASITGAQYVALKMISSGDGHSFLVPRRTYVALKKRGLVDGYAWIRIKCRIVYKITEAGIEAMVAYASANNLRAVERANIPVWAVAK